MPVNKFALIRYKTIDNCLQNRFRRWTLDDLVEACADALYEYEGVHLGVSKRTVQLDIQTMRSDKIGYNAPIEVFDKRFYRYAEKGYSITNIPLSGQDLSKLNEAVEMLKQFKGFKHFQDVGEMVTRLEDKIQSSANQGKGIVQFETNDLLKGLEFLDVLYNAISKNIVVEINYKGFKATESLKVVFHGYLLKEYRNRWFVLGINDKGMLLTLALDRIEGILSLEKVKFVKNKLFNPETYFDNAIGVTKNLDTREIQITFWVDSRNAPYLITKPVHATQKLLSSDSTGSVFSIDVVWNFELEREILGFGESMKLLTPRKLKSRIKSRLKNALGLYEVSGEKD